MMPRYRNICIFGKYMQNNSPLMLSLLNCPALNDTSQQVRSIKKHYDQKFRKERAKKFIKIDLDDRTKKQYNYEEMDKSLKDYGMLPNRDYREKPEIFYCTPDIFERYVVPEGDGKFSAITTKGVKQNVEYIGKKSKSYMALRKIKDYEDGYTNKYFAQEALEIYKKGHEALATRDRDQILQYFTESAYPLVTHNLQNKTVVWKFVESLEPPRVVHARVTHTTTKQDLFAQITVRFHSQQYLCIYDRFGRPLLGSETVKKDVLDYVVFEKHLSDSYGVWRIQGKIIPDWMDAKETPSTTYVMPKEEEEPLPTDSSETD
ncbi:unnamed protein product [Xylocopa violacea]|uniref:Large ribosomal subunit protein mL45 n=1 Tax=Xylocopa violacea TaxID=135666 RepID=A0ABP1NGR5_XYLVO